VPIVAINQDVVFAFGYGGENSLASAIPSLTDRKSRQELSTLFSCREEQRRKRFGAAQFDLWPSYGQARDRLWAESVALNRAIEAFQA